MTDSTPQAHPPTEIRAEIQGLRAIAVMVVLIFHIWPRALPGGFVGVDVFFVISGYLITGLLLREAERSGRISLPNFYARRIRRLLPAASAVIIVSCLCFQLLPEVKWMDTAKDAFASALYVQNWNLAYGAVDYMAANNSPGIFQHFWSLSIEEQYYIAYPLIVAAIFRCSQAARARPARVFVVTVVTLGSASLIYSIYLSNTDPAFAYFATTTRAWSLPSGGCSQRQHVRSLP
jgi:peptidoglycan/LPS O-acetylase OafA/YrhL